MSYKEHYYDDEADWKEQDGEDRIAKGENTQLSPGLSPFRCEKCRATFYQNYLDKNGICFSCIENEKLKPFWNGLSERECVEFAKTVNK